MWEERKWFNIFDMNQNGIMISQYCLENYRNHVFLPKIQFWQDFPVNKAFIRFQWAPVFHLTDHCLLFEVIGIT